ncbi:MULTISPECIES: D-alanyl-D-alanine carboxypeptidase/D-alanyl-D-alanine-endopeptidase [unclassified Ruegeria]|uniref:D-alanyl-D-alanine carboxypeptidase/D-alanyl-D-alanine endopeptidase n=1 Tax=unclassified Ruegeria TaxID=2625375 RepID=UPI001ADD45D4|nr:MULTISPECIES: D-alanyl-D-alanine carboxypeptidase/D-alanyl-D-alanine-endopeptidase [unclassified Ruegeria]MBO9411467.1 D-alanyl-D-alanine carboxypeptidase/D-alanyl-D-alanine-endopeptidase [Ruegeria sp. R8_1]MBO9415971.1 D-alanyl-D-alanine carboxypeptidase/D-alanyl-D-alanine-endopeptidase [Ruegeria sp. R8_2]
MADRFTRRFVLAGLGAAMAPGVALANAPLVSLRPQLRGAQPLGAERLIQAAGLRGEVAFAVADAQTGVELEAVGGDLGLPPASVAKALTALYALDVLGPEFRFETKLVADGTIENGVLNGDLILVGGGDPLLDTDALATMAANLREVGITEVRGAFKVYDGALPYVFSIDPGQPDHLGYSPSISGISLNFNRVHFEWKRAGTNYDVTMDARSARYKPAVDMATMWVEARKAPIYTYEASARQDRWTVARAALGNGGARWLPVRKPALYAGDVFRTLARSNGIVLDRVQVTRQAPVGLALVVHNSDQLDSILRGMLKYSTNITAEMVGMTASRARGAELQSLTDSADEMNLWAAETYGVDGVAMVDHSGLGDASRIAPSALVKMLVAAQKSGALRPLLKRFNLTDSQGRPVKNHPIKVDAKTGTLNFVSGLGGFITTPDGSELAFAIFTADVDHRAKIPRSQRERPSGARSWNSRSRRLQRALIARWGTLSGS